MRFVNLRALARGHYGWEVRMVLTLDHGTYSEIRCHVSDVSGRIAGVLWDELTSEPHRPCAHDAGTNSQVNETKANEGQLKESERKFCEERDKSSLARSAVVTKQTAQLYV